MNWKIIPYSGLFFEMDSLVGLVRLIIYLLAYSSDQLDN